MRTRGLERFAWLFLAYLVAVILFGAWVRITGSGAGCGSHWPLCDGEIAPTAPGTEKLIEYTHRVTSGLCGPLALLLVLWARRPGGAVFRWAVATFLFVLVEGGIGALLVLEELVADNASVARAVVVGLHLTNTLALTACAAGTAWAAGDRPAIRLGAVARSRFAPALLLLVLSGATGAMTALGDTLFPIESSLGPGLLDKLREGASAANHFLVRLRVMHPIAATAAAGYLLWVLIPVSRRLDETGNWARAGLWLTATEMAAGVVNVALAAPPSMQIVHLLLANLLWVSAWLTAVGATNTREQRVGKLVSSTLAQPAGD